MTKHNTDQSASGTTGKFPEPRGWAMGWVFGQSAAHSPTESELPDGHEAGEKFAEPRGWALKWDGFALSEADKR
jgi:hypothetical protein